ncbi:uncharacterized protein LOC132037206 isoform X1 [Lycium ferocissimum]|uniref:uncharacterized protein LOC132037206 isoform X1 n=1 Tax=Lycium ferocissimum TaxID=112874 RepID=UPI0028165CCC|nr:uncharacterized protein LOC132037206 isoform X1 [Lycium ferocissimum]
MSDHHGPAQVNCWKDPMSPSQWKEEHFVIVSLSGWGLLFYGGYKLFTGGKKNKEECCWTKIQTSLLWSPSSPCSPKLAAEPVVLPVSSVSLSCSTSRKCGKSGGLVDEQTRLTSLGSLSKYRLMCHR